MLWRVRGILFPYMALGALVGLTIVSNLTQSLGVLHVPPLVASPSAKSSQADEEHNLG